MRINLAISAVFIWIGFIGAISFMEAWMKFQAPGVTLPIGLGIGRLVFSALNKMEWTCLLVMLYSLYPFKKTTKKYVLFIGIPSLLLLIQTVWTLPSLDARALAFIDGTNPPASKIHLIHVLSEGLKMISLFVLGFQLFTLQQKKKGL